MRRYEAMYIVDPDLDDAQFDRIVEKYRKIVTDGGGNILHAAKWEQGRRKLAYDVSKRREGMYILMIFESDADVPKELDRIFRISDDTFRHLVVRQDEDRPLPITSTQEAGEPKAEATPAAEAEPTPEPVEAPVEEE